MANPSHPHTLARRSFLLGVLGGAALGMAHKACGFEHPVTPGVVNQQEAWQRICRVIDAHNVDGYVGFDDDDLALFLRSGGPLCGVEGVGVGSTRAADAVEQAIERYHLNFRDPATCALLIIAAPTDSWYSMESHRAYATFRQACAPSQLLEGVVCLYGFYREATLNDVFKVTFIVATTGRER